MIKNLTGQVFGRLTVMDCAGVNAHGSALWKCKCECGTIKTIDGQHLRKGAIKSCGCLRKDLPATMFRTHGLRNHPLYVVWVDMRRRCDNKTNSRYKDYGGRGITICEEWYDFKKFYDWAIAGYKKGLSLDRINNDGNYEPSNCRWATRTEQANNKRNNRTICIDGVNKHLLEWCHEYNIEPSTALTRIKRGWSEKDAITKPVRKGKYAEESRFR